MLNKLMLLIVLSVTSMAVTAQDTHLKPYYEYDSATVKPGFPGGQQALTTWLDSAIAASALTDTGIVKVWFVVEADGLLSNIRITQRAGNDCDIAAERIIAAMPPWTNGKYGEYEVAVAVELRVRFE